MNKNVYYILLAAVSIVFIALLYVVIAGGDSKSKQIMIEYNHGDTDYDAKRSSIEYQDAAKQVCEQFFESLKIKDKAAIAVEYTGFGKYYGHDDSCRITYSDVRGYVDYSIGSK